MNVRLQNVWMDRYIYDRSKKQLCFMCDQPADTGEHIPPKCFFTTSIRSSCRLLTVPACNYHNESTKKDDEYARTVIATGSSGNKLAWDLLEERVFSGGSRGLINSLYGKMAPTGILDSGGEELYKFDLERARLERVIEKITAGTYWHKNGSRIPDGYTITPYSWNPKMEVDQWNEILRLPIQYLGHPDVFQFRYGKVANDENTVIIAMAFFAASHIVLSIICSVEFYRKMKLPKLNNSRHEGEAT